MVFDESDTGPFYMSPSEREKRKLWEYRQVKRKAYIEDRMIEMLKEYSIIDPQGKMKKMQEQCVALNLPIKQQEPIICKGWVNKPKVSFQILFEQDGLIHPTFISIQRRVSMMKWEI
jgi:hypothetical protein